MNKKKFVLPILLIANLLCMMDVSIMTIVIPKIQTAFNENLSNLSWTVNIYNIVFATLIIPFARLAERFGKNRFVFIGLITFGLASLITGLSPNLPVMLFARAIQSIGAAIIIPTSMVIGLEQNNTENRNKVIGALAGAQGLAVALGPTVGGFVSQYWSWRWVFFINVPLIVLLVLVYPFVLSINHESRQRVKIDWMGALLSCISLFTMSLGLIKGNDWKWNSPTIISLFIISLLSFVLFITQEKHTKFPMINLHLFKSNNFKGSSIALLLCNYFMGGMVILIPTLLTKVQGESELNSALLITPYSVSVTITVITASRLVKKINHKLLIGSGFIIIAISYFILANLKIQDNYNRLIIAGILLGIGYGLVAATANILVAADFHGSDLTDSQSVANIFRQIGLIFATALFTSILAGNIKTAKQETINYAHQIIKTKNINTTIKNKMIRKLDDKLDPNKSSNNNVNSKTSISYNKTKIEQVALKKAYEQQLTMIAQQKGTSSDKLPDNVKQMVKTKVKALLLPKIKTKEQQTINQVNRTISVIKQYLNGKMTKAFMNVYYVMTFVPIIALTLLPLFKRKKD